MDHRISLSFLAIVLAAALPGPCAGQAVKKTAGSKTTTSAKKSAVVRTPWGDPDLQGVWNDATSTPMQRPGGVGVKDVLTDEEAAEFQEKLANDLTRDRRDGGA